MGKKVYFCSAKLQKRKKTMAKNNESKTRKAIKEIEEGKGIICHSFDEFLAAVK